MGGLVEYEKRTRRTATQRDIAVLPAVALGRHELRIDKAGYEPIDVAFNYSGKRTEIEIDEALMKAASTTPNK